MKRLRFWTQFALAVYLPLAISPAQAQWFGNSPNSRADARSAAIAESDFATQQDILRSQINSAAAYGQINPGEAIFLSSRMNGAEAMLQSAASSGNLTNGMASSILGIFNQVANELSNAGIAVTLPENIYPFSNSYSYSNNNYMNPNISPNSNSNRNCNKPAYASKDYVRNWY